MEKTITTSAIEVYHRICKVCKDATKIEKKTAPKETESLNDNRRRYGYSGN